MAFHVLVECACVCALCIIVYVYALCIIRVVDKYHLKVMHIIHSFVWDLGGVVGQRSCR